MARRVRCALRPGSRGKALSSFLIQDRRVMGPAGPSEATWIQGDEGSLTVSGPVEFPLGNVGRDAGTLVLKGKFGTEGTITGGATFFRLDQDPKDPKASPSKSGRFKAIVLRVDDHPEPSSAIASHQRPWQWFACAFVRRSRVRRLAVAQNVALRDTERHPSGNIAKL